jgi:hypothetical protein
MFNNRWDGSMVQEETLEIEVLDALMFTVDTITIEDMLSSGDATTASTKPGTLIERELMPLNGQLVTVSDSPSDLRWMEVSLLVLETQEEVIWNTSELWDSTQITNANTLSMILEPNLLDGTLTEDGLSQLIHQMETHTLLSDNMLATLTVKFTGKME